MALLTDDSDLNETYLRTMHGGNGDYYIEIREKKDGVFTTSCVRISTSGGNAPTSVKIAAAELFRAMEAEGLNAYPER